MAPRGDFLSPGVNLSKDFCIQNARLATFILAYQFQNKVGQKYVLFEIFQSLLAQMEGFTNNACSGQYALHCFKRMYG